MLKFLYLVIARQKLNNTGEALMHGLTSDNWTANANGFFFSLLSDSSQAVKQKGELIRGSRMSKATVEIRPQS